MHRHAEDRGPLTAQQHTAAVYESLEGRDNGEVGLKVSLREAEAEAERFALVVLAIKLQYLQQVLGPGGSVVHLSTDTLTVFWQVTNVTPVTTKSKQRKPQSDDQRNFRCI